MNDTQFYSPLQKNAAYYRAEARKRLTNNYGIALLAVLLGSIFGAATTDGFSVSPNFDLEKEEIEQLISPQFLDYLSALLPILITGAIVGAITSIAFSLFVSSPVMLGYQRFFLALHDGEEEKKNVSTLFSYFSSDTYLKSVLLNLFHSLILVAASLPAIAGLIVGAIVVFIPMMWPLAIAIIAAGALITAIVSLPLNYTYTYAHLIMAEYPTLSPAEALRNSRNLMRGKKWKLFCLDFSFIGWVLLSLLTLGIGFLFLIPYLQAARVAFYHDIANREAAMETEFPSLNPDDYTETTDAQ